MYPENLYPLVIVAAELNCGIRDIDPKHIVRNEDGLRCVPGHVVKALIDERRSYTEPPDATSGVKAKA